MNDSARLCSLLLFLLALAGTAPAQKIGEVTRAEPTAKSPREMTLEWTSDAGRPYWYRLPKKIDDRKPPNLILMLHGTGLNHGWSFWNYRIDGGHFRSDDIVISPDGCTPGGSTYNFVQNDTDGDQIAQLITTFRAEFPVGNVYLYGHSQGAFFCYWFAGEHPGLVDGIVAHAGNVLQVKHPKHAIENIAIGILHADSDQVVPVDCAHRTEKIYREKGYKKLKCYVVEGIRDEAGHWPLPVQVGEMLAWCDQVCAKTAGSALDIASLELAKKDADLLVVRDAMDNARKLLKKHRGDDKDALEERLAALDAWWETAAAATFEAVGACAGAEDSRAEYGSWVELFLAARAVFGEHKDWKRSCAALERRAKSESKKVATAIKRLGKSGPKALDSGIETWMASVCAPNMAALRVAIEGHLTSSVVGRKSDAVRQFEALRAERATADAAGRAEFDKVIAAVERPGA